MFSRIKRWILGPMHTVTRMADGRYLWKNQEDGSEMIRFSLTGHPAVEAKLHIAWCDREQACLRRERMMADMRQVIREELAYAVPYDIPVEADTGI
jgi:hypothetical protein